MITVLWYCVCFCAPRLKQELSNLEASLLASSQLPEQKSTPPNLVEVVEEVEVSEEEVHQLQQQLLEMKRGFDKVVVERHILSQSYQAIADKLRSSNHLLERWSILLKGKNFFLKKHFNPISSLKPRQEAWLKKLNSLPGSRSLLVDCVLASAISVYCGPLSTNARLKRSPLGACVLCCDVCVCVMCDVCVLVMCVHRSCDFAPPSSCSHPGTRPLPH